MIGFSSNCRNKEGNNEGLGKQNFSLTEIGTKRKYKFYGKDQWDKFEVPVKCLGREVQKDRGCMCLKLMSEV